MKGEIADATKLLQLRAEAIRSDGGRSILVGIAAVVFSESLIVFQFGARATGPWFWVHAGVVGTAVVATLALLAAYHLARPNDQALLRNWLPAARCIGLMLDVSIIVSPWILLPMAEPLVAGMLYLLYGWFLAVKGAFGTDDRTGSWLALLGLPASLSLWLLTEHAPLAVPLSAFFCLIGVSLWFFERRRLCAQAEAYNTRLRSERAVGELLARLNASTMAAVPVDDQPIDPLSTGQILTARQLEVLRHIARGHSNKEIARELKISPATVKVHVAQILATTGASNRTTAAIQLLRQG